MGLERHTVAKYMDSGPPQAQTRCRASSLQPFQDYLKQRLSQGCGNAVVLLREIKAIGYEGGRTPILETPWVNYLKSDTIDITRQ